MMATCVPEGGDVESITPLVGVLTNKTAPNNDRIEAYSALARKLMADSDGAFKQEVLSNHSSQLAQLFSRDLSHGGSDIIPAALQALGFFTHDKQLASAISPFELSSLISSICNVLLKTTNKTTCTRALWVLSIQTFPVEIVAAQVHPILCAVEHSLVNGDFHFKSLAVKFEALSAIKRLLEQAPKQMFTHVVRWSKLVYPMVTHSAAKLREKAFVTMEMSLGAMLLQKDDLSKSLAVDLKKGMVNELISLMNGHEVFALKVWGIFVQLLGTVLHHGSLINLLLPVVERGFKSISNDVRVEAFTAWNHLIDNFATNQAILGDHKRIKLIMQVFRAASAKTEKVALAKLNSWWYYIRKLGEKASSNFESVCAPLLYFCLGSGTPNGATTPARNGKLPPGLTTPTMSRLGVKNFLSPATPHLSLSPSGMSSTTFKSVQLRGCEVLTYFLGGMQEDVTRLSYVFQLDPLDHDIISSPGFFAKNYESFLLAVKEALVTLGNAMDDGLLFKIWYSLIAHLKNVLDLPNKKEHIDVFTSFLRNFHLIVISECVDTVKLLKMFQAITCLPSKALSSQAYHVGNTGVMHGTPSLFLSGVLLEPNFAVSCTGQERYFSIFETLISSGMQNQATCLSFCQSLLQLLEKTAGKLENTESLWRLWSMVVNPLLINVMQTNEVNQGDSLEHNFDCMYAALIYPVNHLLHKELHQATVKSIMKTWREIYQNFARLSAMVTNAEANISCEELCVKILNDVAIDKVESFVMVDSLVMMTETIVQCLDFSTFSNQMSFNNIAPLSPAKYSKKKQRPLGNLHMFVKLLSCLMKRLMHGSNLEIPATTPNSKKSGGLNQTASNMITILSTLFTQAPASSTLSNLIGRLAADMANLMEEIGKKTGSLYNWSHLGQKVEKLWIDVTAALQSKYTGLFDSEFLLKMAPLFEVMFLYSRKSVKTQTLSFWNATFGKHGPLEYPESLKPVLAKVKDKSPLVLPGWSDSQTLSIEETPLSQMTQDMTQVPLPQIPGMPSPSKIMGSFLNRPTGGSSPVAAASPMAQAMPPPKPRGSPGHVKKKLSLAVNDLRDDEFVVIAPSPKKRRILTEHQKEILREKKVLPSMYNNLDASMDHSLYSQFYAESQHTLTPDALSGSNPFVVTTSKKQKLDDGSSQATEVVIEKEVENASPSNTVSVKTVSFENISFNIPTNEKDKTEEENILGLEDIDRNSVNDLELGESQSSKDIHSFEIFKSFQDQTKSQPKDINTASNVDDGRQSENKTTTLQPIVAESPLKTFRNLLKAREANNSSPMKKTKPRASNSQSPSRKSPAKSSTKKSTEGLTKLDRWITKSPKKVENSGPVETTAPSSVVVSSLADETRSPCKVLNKNTNDLGDAVANESVCETPQKNCDSSFTNDDLHKGARVLFKENENMDISEMNSAKENDENEKEKSPDIIPGSPNEKMAHRITPLLKQAANLPSSPLLKIRKLTQDDIHRLSPMKNSLDSVVGLCFQEQTSLDLNPAIKSSGVTPSSPLTKSTENDSMRKRRCRSSSRIARSKSHLHDDFSEIKPLNLNAKLDKENIRIDDLSDLGKNVDNCEVEKSSKDVDELDTKLTQTLDSGIEGSNPAVEGMESNTEEKMDSQDASEKCSDTQGGEDESQNSPSTQNYFADSSEVVVATETDKSMCDGGTNMADTKVDSESYQGDVSSQDTVDMETTVVKATRKGRKGQPKKLDTSTSKADKKKARLSDDKKGKSKISKISDKRSPTDETRGEKQKAKKKGKKEKKPCKPVKNVSDKNSNLDESDDDIPLSCLSVKSSAKTIEAKVTAPVEVVKGSANEGNQDSCVDMFDSQNTEVASKVVKNQSKDKIKDDTKLEKELKRLKTDMRSPTRKVLRSTKIPFKSKLRLQRRQSFVAKLKKVRKTAKSKILSTIIPDQTAIESGDSQLTIVETPLTNVAENAEEQDKIVGADVNSAEVTNVESDEIQKIASEQKNDGAKTETKNINKLFVRNSPQPLHSVGRNSRNSRSLIMLQKGKKFQKSNRPSGNSPTTQKSFTALKPTSQNAWSLMSRLNAAIVGPETKTKTQTKEADVVRTSSPKRPIGPVLSSDCSPLSSGFPPFTIYSPSASPSSGILKKRRLSDGTVVSESPSPPNKRRVSFAEPIESPSSASKPVNRCLELPKPQLVPSPLVTTTPSKVVQSQSKFITTPVKSRPEDCSVSPSDKDQALFVVPQSTPVHKREKASLTPSITPVVSATQNSYNSTQESQLNCTDPIYPDLIGCSLPVEQVLPKLTTSMWSRGLGTLIRARNIRTIGDLCLLTEYDVNNLPIKSPKITTMKNALDGIKKLMISDKSSQVESSKVDDGKHKKQTENNSTNTSGDLPSIEEEMEKIFHDKNTDDLNTSIEEALETSGELLKDLGKLSQSLSEDVVDSGKQSLGEPIPSSESSSDMEVEIQTSSGSSSQVEVEKSSESESSSVKETEKSGDKDIITALDYLTGNMTADSLSRLPSSQIFQAHTKLSELMMTVATALKNKCQSPNNE